ncbi:hypothetical protein AHAS_Ahas16G0180600 [Arachis hypogaea]
MYGRGTPVLISRENKQSLYMGVARQELGVARQCKFPESNAEGHKRGMAYQAGRGTPSPLHTMGVPLDPWGVACQFINPEGTITWACHLVSKAWHASFKSSLGRAT